MLLHIPNILTSQCAVTMRAAIDVSAMGGRTHHGRQPGRTGQAQPAIARKLRRCAEQGRIILQALAANGQFFSAALPARTMPPLFNRYAEVGNETYGTHVDGAARRVPGSDLWLRTDVSSTLFLCDLEDYDGGELVVEDTYGTHEVKLPAGDLILYPSTSLHRVEPVTRGERVCSFFWTQSMVRDTAKRSLLF